jgi:hypothetical protein
MMIGSLDVEMTHTSNLLSQSDFQKVPNLPLYPSQELAQPLTAHEQQLVVNLPPRFQFRDWELLYSTMEHGISLHTYFDLTRCHTTIAGMLTFVCVQVLSPSQVTQPNGDHH